MEWFVTARDALRITRRAVTQRPASLITERHRTVYGVPADRAIDGIKSAEEELNRVVVLALVAIFERTLRDFVVKESMRHLPSGTERERRVVSQLTQDIEYWHFSQRLLDVFDTVDDDVRGQTRQLIDYRNWVAHGHSASAPPPVNVLPQVAHQRLSEFLRQAGIL